MACSSGGKLEVSPAGVQFPVGLRVLVVDDDDVCLRVLDQMLRRCMYQVTCCSQAKVALNLLRERKGCFDLVLSDVHMPDMDGFKLLELVGLEMDLPVIMMSADGRTSLVMRGIRHGACDYLIKPIRDEELKNIWQHVVRKRWNETTEHDHLGNLEDHDRLKRTQDDAEYTSSTNEDADELIQTQKKRRGSKDGDDIELENDDSSTAKRPRVVWSVELHQQFVSAVNQLGLEKAVPKRILELMNVPELTRENVASHLQKFRLYLKRLSGVSQQGLLPYYEPVEQNLKLTSLERSEIHALVASAQFLPQTLAALQTELLSQSATNLILPAMDPRTLSRTSNPGSGCIPSDPNVSYGRPLIRCSRTIAKQICQPLVCNENVCSEFAGWSSKNLGDIVPYCNLATVEANNNMLITSMELQQQNQSVTVESTRSLNVRPSCLVLPSQSSPIYQAGNSPVSFNQNCSFSDQTNSLLKLSKSSLAMEAERKPGGMAFKFITAVNPISQVANMNSKHGSYSSKLNMVPGSAGNSLKKTSIPSRFAFDEHELASSSTTQTEASKRVKQEPNMDLTEDMEVGIPLLLQLPTNVSMSVFSD